MGSQRVRHDWATFISLNGWGLPRWPSGKESACQCRRHKRGLRSLRQEDPLEEEMATHSSIVAWRIHGQRSLVGYIQSMGLQRVERDWVTEYWKGERASVFSGGRKLKQRVRYITQNLAHDPLYKSYLLPRRHNPESKGTGSHLQNLCSLVGWKAQLKYELLFKLIVG